MSRSRVHLKKNVTSSGLRPHQWAKLLNIEPETYGWIWRDPTIDKITVSAPASKRRYFEENPHWLRTEDDDFDTNMLYYIMELPDGA